MGTNMRGFLGLAVASLVALWPTQPAAQTDTPDLANVRTTSGCPEAFQQFYACALEKIKTARPPRTADGKPNFAGLWGRNAGLLATTLFGDNSPIIEPRGTIPYQPWAQEKQKELFRDYVDPVARCMPHG